MKTKSGYTPNRWSTKLRPIRSTLALAALVAIMGGSSPASATALRLTNTGLNTEGLQTFQLGWDASSNATYLVQSAASLAPGTQWNTLDEVTPADSTGRLPVPLVTVVNDANGLSSPPAAFFRLVLPQPQIFAVEPAIIAPGVPVNFYVLGQSFPTNALVQVNGVTQSGANFSNSSTLVLPTFTPAVAGTYQVSLVISGVVVSAFNVVCGDALANPELVLQGPPTEPPASAAGKFLSKRGYDYYKAQSDYGFDVEQTLNIGSQSSGAGVGKKDFKGHVTLLKAFDDGSDDARTGGGDPPASLLMPALMKAKEKANQLWQPGIPDPGGPMAALLMPALMKAKEKANQTKCGNNLRVLGVQLFSGEVQEGDVDLAIPGRGLDFICARTYRSRVNHTATMLGNCWTFSYDVRCAQNSSGGVDVYDGTGRKDTFTLGTNGVYTCPEFFREGSLNNNTFTLTFADTGRWVFNPFDGSAGAGKLIQIITRNGDSMTLGYDTGGRLVQVVDDLGRTNTLSYNTSGQLASVTDFSGRSVTYQYYSGAKSDNGSAGDLQSVTSPPVTGTSNGNDYPSGKTTTYTYSKSFPLDRENHLLLTVTDPKGQPAAVFTYEHSSTSANYLCCIAAQAGTSTASCFTYSAFTGTPHVPLLPASWCLVNDPVGNVSQYYFDARNRCLIEDDYTGRATPGLPVTATVNRPTGQLRSSDPAYYETTWSWNNDSLCTAETFPGGQQLQYVYQSDFDPTTTARKRADCRVVREIASSAVDLNGDGIPDVTARAWYFTYDSRFGSSGSSPSVQASFTTAKRACLFNLGLKGRMAAPPRGSGGGEELPKESLSLAGRGWDGTVKGLVVSDANGMAIKTKGTGADKNRVAVAAQWPNDGDLDFNDQSVAYNFAVSATDPRGNVTTASYDAQGNILLRLRKRPELLYQDWQESFAYDNHGQLIAVTNAADVNGRSRVDTFSWSQGQITNCVVDAGGLALASAFEYDVRGNLTRYVDPRTNDWLFVYNSLDQLVQASSALSANGSLSTFRTATQLAYDANDNLVQTATELRDPTGTLQGSRADNFQYDGEDRLSQAALAVDASHALTNRYAYDGNNECVQVLGGKAVSGADPHQTVTYQYDERGLLYSQSFATGSPAQSTDQFSYTLNGRLGAANGGVEKPGYTCTFTYDGFDRPTSFTDPMGNQTVCYYDANNNLKVVRQFGELNDVPGSAGNVRLAESDYQYDGLHRCVSALDLFFNSATQAAMGSGQSLSTCTYAPNDECVSVTDTLCHTTTYGYDTACRPVSIADALGNQQSVVYDADGNPLAEISSELPAAGGKPQVLSVTNGYDALNRCVSRTDSAGNTSSYAYDSLDRCVQTIDPRGVYAFYSYDFLDRCTLAFGDLNGDGIPDFTSDITTTYSWSSSSGNLLAVTDSNTNTTSYAYDSLGRCLTVTHADGTQAQMTWDPRSNLIWEQDANGTTITNTYDLCDRIVHRDLACRNVLATTTFETFAYDGCGRLTGASNDSGTNAFAYDSLDDCVSETLNGLTTSSTYDAFGNRLSLTYPGGRALTYTYDALNRCASISDSGQQLASYTYDGPDRISQISYGNGTKTQFTYDGFAGTPNVTGDHGFGQISRVRHGIVAGGVVIDDRTFSYDPDQNKILRDVTSPLTIGGVAPAQSFQYDPACRLVAALVTTNGAVARLTTYGLDRMGNRTNVTGETCSGTDTLSSTIPPADFQMNRYTTTPCDSRTYDSDGNLVSVSSSAGPVTYQYDYAGRLVQVQTLNSGTGTLAPAVSYTYDAVGRRMHKTVYAAGQPPATTQFLYDGSRVIEERNGTTTTATYVCGDGVQDGNETDLDCGGACLSMNRSGQNYYLHTDDQGNVLALSGANGGVVERYDYDDYGAVTFLTSAGYPSSATSSTVGNPYCWGGLRLDAETGLQNDDGGSYLEPQTGRAIRGKVKNIKIDSTYFVGNNPWSPSSPPPVTYRIKALTSGDGKKEYVGHVSLLK
jgi:YD repeat-containing protein